jgi:putative endonuclease
MRDRTYFAYIMAGDSGAIYTGVTSNLPVRIRQHKQKLVPGFTQKYNITKLVWCEPHSSILAAISHEKEIKGWRRSKKVALIEKGNPGWKDLSLPQKSEQANHVIPTGVCEVRNPSSIDPPGGIPRASSVL